MLTPVQTKAWSMQFRSMDSGIEAYRSIPAAPAVLYAGKIAPSLTFLILIGSVWLFDIVWLLYSVYCVSKEMEKIKAVSDEFLRLAIIDNHEDLSHMKLQKLLYCAYGWGLAILNERLFSDKIQVWEYGPIIASIYRRFRRSERHRSCPLLSFQL